MKFDWNKQKENINIKKNEYDFTNAQQGKFYVPIEELDIPVYDETDYLLSNSSNASRLLNAINNIENKRRFTMTTQRIELNISNDIFDKVMFFLENLPKNKISFNFEPSPKKLQERDIFSQTAGILSSQKIDPIEWQNQIRSEWD